MAKDDKGLTPNDETVLLNEGTTSWSIDAL